MDAESSIKALGSEALRDLYNNLVQAKSFAIEQAPDVCRQIITWEIAKAILAACVLLVAGVIVRHICKSMWNWVDATGTELGRHISVFLIIGYTLAFFGVSTGEIASGLKALIAPKVFLIEYIAHIVK